MPDIVAMCFRFMRVAFWLTATGAGVCSMICLMASFTEPLFAGKAIGWFAYAVALLYARDATPT